MKSNAVLCRSCLCQKLDTALWVIVALHIKSGLKMQRDRLNVQRAIPVNRLHRSIA